MKISLRMNLSDFINKDSEKEVINKLENVHNDDIKYYLTLWYRDGKILPVSDIYFFNNLIFL